MRRIPGDDQKGVFLKIDGRQFRFAILDITFQLFAGTYYMQFVFLNSLLTNRTAIRHALSLLGRVRDFSVNFLCHRILKMPTTA